MKFMLCSPSRNAMRFSLRSLGCDSILIRVLPSTFLSCALTVNAIGLLFLRQCLYLLLNSTVNSVSGMSQKLTLCNIVSHYAIV
jgi:hypothetical protein